LHDLFHEEGIAFGLRQEGLPEEVNTRACTEQGCEQLFSLLMSQGVQPQLRIIT